MMESLPRDIRILILSFLSLRDCFTFARTCKEYHLLLREPYFWKAKLEGDFPQMSVGVYNYKSDYMRLYIQKHERSVYEQKLRYKIAKRNFSSVRYTLQQQLGDYLLPIYQYRYYQITISETSNVGFHDFVIGLDGQSVPEVEYTLKKWGNFPQNICLCARDIVKVMYNECVYWILVVGISRVTLVWKNRGDKLYDVIEKTLHLTRKDISKYNISDIELYL